MELEKCIHQGRRISTDKVECSSNHFVGPDFAIRRVSLCNKPCPFLNKPNFTKSELNPANNRVSGIGDRLKSIIQREIGRTIPCDKCKEHVLRLNQMLPNEVREKHQDIVKQIASRAKKESPRFWQRLAVTIDQALHIGETERRIGAWIDEAIREEEQDEEDEEPSIKWAYGITTVPERLNELFPRTLASLRDAGFCDPWVFVDGMKEPSAYQQFGTSVTVRYPKMKTFGNWMLSLWELYIRTPDADRYAIFQDDFVTCHDLRQYLDLCEYPEKGYWNLYTFPKNQKLCRKNFTGWYRTRQKGWGAVALVFNSDAMTTLLGHPWMIQKPKETRRKHRAVDFVVATIMQRAGWKEYVHNPSLVQHTGIKSSMGNGQQPLANSFRGEDFSAMELVQR